MLNFVICDDNSPVLIRLSKMLESIFINYNVDAKIGLATDNSSILFDYIEKNSIDVLILDINLKSNISGCDIADIVRKKNKSVYLIFCTGHLEYALLAYKYKTFDYLSKPITQDRLEETILRLVDDVNTSPANFIRINSKTVINESDINYVKKDGMKTVFCTNAKNLEAYGSFSQISSKLPDNFIRCHKSYIVNVNHISNFNMKNNTILLDNNEICPIGAKYKNNFLEVLRIGNFTNSFDYTNK